MPRRHATLLIPALLSLFVGRSALAGPWTKEPGQAYVKLSETFFFAGSFVNSLGLVQQNSRYFNATTSLYAEVGLLPHLHFQGSLPYSVGINRVDEGDFVVEALHAGSGDLQLGLQYSPWAPLPAAVRAEVKIPLYNPGRRFTPLEQPYYPAIGDGQVDVTLWLSAGGSWVNAGLYGFAEAGYVFRTEASPGELPEAPGTQQAGRVSFRDSAAWRAELGWAPLRRSSRSWASSLLVIGGVSGVVALTDDRYTRSSVQLGFKLYTRVYRGLALEASFDPGLWAKNAARGIGTSLGVSYQL